MAATPTKPESEAEAGGSKDQHALIFNAAVIFNRAVMHHECGCLAFTTCPKFWHARHHPIKVSWGKLRRIKSHIHFAFQQSNHHECWKQLIGAKPPQFSKADPFLIFFELNCFLDLGGKVDSVKELRLPAPLF